MDEEAINLEKSAALADRGFKVAPRWFIQSRKTGEIFWLREKQAWNQLRPSKGNVLIGMSDGRTYDKIVKEAKAELAEKKVRLQEIKDEINKFIAAYDNLRYNEGAAKNDPRLANIMKEKSLLEEEQDKVKASIEGSQHEVKIRAREAEMEVARENPVMPTNQDVMTPQGSRGKIMQHMGVPEGGNTVDTGYVPQPKTNEVEELKKQLEELKSRLDENQDTTQGTAQSAGKDTGERPSGAPGPSDEGGV
jgi:predicted nuclease with TOPRIM domain